MKNFKELLFDEARPTLTLTSGGGREMRFEQVYTSEREGVLYCILRPLVPVKGLDAQSAIVFYVDEAGKLRAVRDAALADAVFSEYYDALIELKGRDGV